MLSKMQPLALRHSPNVLLKVSGTSSNPVPRKGHTGPPQSLLKPPPGLHRHSVGGRPSLSTLAVEAELTK